MDQASECASSPRDSDIRLQFPSPLISTSLRWAIIGAFSDYGRIFTRKWSLWRCKLTGGQDQQVCLAIERYGSFPRWPLNPFVGLFLFARIHISSMLMK